MSDLFKKLLEIDDESMLRRDGDAAAAVAQKRKMVVQDQQSAVTHALIDLAKKDHSLFLTAMLVCENCPVLAKQIAAESDTETILSPHFELRRAIKLAWIAMNQLYVVHTMEDENGLEK